MAHRGGRKPEYANYSEMRRIDHLLAMDPPKISILEGAMPKQAGVQIQEKNMRLHQICSDEGIKYVYGKKGRTIHDKSCPNLKGMATDSLCTSDVFLLHMKPCQECFLKACVRAGGNVAELDRYKKFFDKVRINDYLLRQTF